MNSIQTKLIKSMIETDILKDIDAGIKGFKEFTAIIRAIDTRDYPKIKVIAKINGHDENSKSIREIREYTINTISWTIADTIIYELR